MSIQTLQNSINNPFTHSYGVAPEKIELNLNNPKGDHPLQNCRLYYSQMQIDPQRSVTYNNRSSES
jgi:hypothetical protein